MPPIRAFQRSNLGVACIVWLVNIPRVPDLFTAAIRTDYTNDHAWQETWSALIAVYPDADFEWDVASLIAVEAPALADLSAGHVALLEREGDHAALVVIAARSLSDHTAVVIDVTSATAPEPFRSTPEQLQGILDNLAVGNISFSEFAAHAAEDGVFRGFHT
jgi:hypothetical protein